MVLFYGLLSVAYLEYRNEVLTMQIVRPQKPGTLFLLCKVPQLCGPRPDHSQERSVWLLGSAIDVLLTPIHSTHSCPYHAIRIQRLLIVYVTKLNVKVP